MNQHIFPLIFEQLVAAQVQPTSLLYVDKSHLGISPQFLGHIE